MEASNATLLCTIKSAGIEATCVYKPIAGERPLWDFPTGTLAGREVAAYLVSSAAGWNFVPPTVMRDGPFGPGMCQLWIDLDPDADLIALSRRIDHAGLRDMAVFDAVINNADRKIGHLLPVPDGHLYGCDHGICFAEEYKLRTVLWQWRGKSLPGRSVEVLRRLADELAGGWLARGAEPAPDQGGDRRDAVAGRGAAGQPGPPLPAAGLARRPLAPVLGRGGHGALPAGVTVQTMPGDLAPDRRNLRVSHEDRDQVAEQLRVAAGDGRLTADELDERLETALTARTYGSSRPSSSTCPPPPAPGSPPPRRPRTWWQLQDHPRHDQAGRALGGPAPPDGGGPARQRAHRLLRRCHQPADPRPGDLGRPRQHRADRAARGRRRHRRHSDRPRRHHPARSPRAGHPGQAAGHRVRQRPPRQPRRPQRPHRPPPQLLGLAPAPSAAAAGELTFR